MALNQKDIGTLQSQAEQIRTGADAVKKTAAHDLFRLLSDADGYVNYNLPDDMQKISDAIKEGRDTIMTPLKDPETIKISDIMTFTSLKTSTAPIAKAIEANKYGVKIDNLYRNLGTKGVITGLPIRDQIDAKVRKNAAPGLDLKIENIEAIITAGGIPSEADIKKVADAIGSHRSLKFGAFGPDQEIYNTIAKILITLSQISMIRGSARRDTLKKDQLDFIKPTVDTLEKQVQSLEIYTEINKTLSLVEKRKENYALLKANTISESHTLGRDTRSNDSIPLGTNFFNAGLVNTTIPESYTLSAYTLKSGNGTVIPTFSDISGGPIIALKKGESQNIYVANPTITGTPITYKKIGTIKLDATNQLVTEYEAFDNFPASVKPFPLSLDMTITGVGGKGTDGQDDKVGIQKVVNMKINMPDYSNQFDTIVSRTGAEAESNRIFNQFVDSTLEIYFYQAMEEHLEPATKEMWKTLTSNEKNHFFDMMVMNPPAPGVTPRTNFRGIDAIQKSNHITPANFFAAFKAMVLADFKKDVLDKSVDKNGRPIQGNTQAYLGTYIREKFGMSPYYADPKYIQGVFKSTIGDRFVNAMTQPEVTTGGPSNINHECNNYIMELRGTNSTLPAMIPREQLPGYQGPIGPDSIENKAYTDRVTLDVALADTGKLVMEQSNKQATQESQEKYAQATAWGFGRAKHFFFGRRDKTKRIRELMKDKQGLSFSNETDSAVDRRSLTKALNMKDADKIKEIDITTQTIGGVTNPNYDAVFTTELNTLSQQYMKDELDEEAFKITTKNLIANNQKVKDIMKTEKIEQIGTNIINVIKFEKEQRKLYAEWVVIADKFINGDMTKDELKKIIQGKLAAFVKEQKRLPDALRELSGSTPDSLVTPEHIDLAEKIVANRVKLAKLGCRTEEMRMVEVRVKVLADRDKDESVLTAAQSVDMKKSGFMKFITGDVPHDAPWYKKMGPWLAGGVSIGATAASGLLIGGGLGIGIGATLLGAINVIKKFGHFTDEHAKFEKELLSMPEARRKEYLAELEKNAEKRPSWLRRAWPTKYDKFGKSLGWIDKCNSIQSLKTRLQNYVSIGKPLSAGENISLKDALTKAIATVELHKEEGRNFTYSTTGHETIEKEMSELYRTILGGLQRLAPHVNPADTYTTIATTTINTEKESEKNRVGYNDDQQNFRRTRLRKIAALGGAKAAGFYLASAWAIGQIKEGISYLRNGHGTATTTIIDPNAHASAIDPSHATTHATNVVDPTHATTHATNAASGALGLDSAFGDHGQDLLHHVFDGDTAKFEAFKNAMLHPSGNTTLRGTMQHIYGGDGRLASLKTHEFFKQFSECILVDNTTGPELIQMATASPVSNNRANTVAAKMHARYAGGATGISPSEYATISDPAKITELMNHLKTTQSFTNLPAGRNLETVNDVLHCNKGGYGKALTDYMYDYINSGKGTITIPTTPPAIPTPPIIPPTGPTLPVTPPSLRVENSWNRGFEHGGYLGIPTHHNEVNNEKDTKNSRMGAFPV